MEAEPWPAPRALRDQIRAARLRHGLTIEAAAEALNVDATTFWWWENGRRPHRLEDRSRLQAFVGAEPETAVVAVDEARAEAAPMPNLASLLRNRRVESGLTIDNAADIVGANPWTLMSWEHGRRAPSCRFFPSIIRFLGREPWPEPASRGEALRAERLRRGLTYRQLAVIMSVDAGSLVAWEADRAPAHAFCQAKLDAFLSGKSRPLKRRLRKKCASHAPSEHV